MKKYTENLAADTNSLTDSAPVTDTTPTSTFDTLPTIDTIAQTPTDDVPGFLPKDYLTNGYLATTAKGETYLRPELVGTHAQTIAAQLSMKPTNFNSLLKELKRSKKSTLPFEARQTAALELIPKAMALVKRKKAPALLLEFVQCNIDHIHDDADWNAFFRHMNAIASYMEGGEV